MRQLDHPLARASRLRRPRSVRGYGLALCAAAALFLAGAALIPTSHTPRPASIMARADVTEVAAPDRSPASVGPAPARAAEAVAVKPGPNVSPKKVEADVLTTAAIGDGSDRGAKVPAALFDHGSLIDQAVPMGGKVPGGMASLAPARAVQPASSTRQLEGKWAANRQACAAGKKRTSYLPLTIDERGARAGIASCSFGNTEQNGNRWAIAAQCRQAGKIWDAKVQLVLNGRQLTWTSERGTQTYTRCL